MNIACCVNEYKKEPSLQGTVLLHGRAGAPEAVNLTD